MSVISLTPNFHNKYFFPNSQSPKFNRAFAFTTQKLRSSIRSVSIQSNRLSFVISNAFDDEPNQNTVQDEDEVNSVGVEAALSMLRFYKREISPLLPKSCRYIPTCSEYSMQAYKKYGVVKGTVLTAWRLCRCNPIGGSGFDPPRWFDEQKPDLPEE